ncbi:quinol:cytochrome C oxidoreductase [Flavobacterium rhizosphaerae]|uniref:Quinol:cytochrome C oxidoreductase n=1 Tax=Flavobacterium rhizosphaerae TaxID=3163298 RepID=A0ABW8YS49_9FLAO
MYTFSSKLKTFAIVLMVLGALGIAYSFFTAPKSVEEAEQIIAAQHAHGHHGEAEHHGAEAVHHSEEAAHVETESHEPVVEGLPEAHPQHGSNDNNDTNGEVGQDTMVTPAPEATESLEANTETGEHIEGTHALTKNATSMEKETLHEDEHDAHAHHAEHVFHQLRNKPWAAVYVAALFFMLLTLGTLAFYAVQNAASAGWSPVLFRVMEGITSYLAPGAVIVFILLVLGVFNVHHLFIWADPEVVAHDHLIQAKSGYLSPVFFLIRAAIFMGGWIFYREYSRRNSLAQDDAVDNLHYKKSFKAAAAFLVFFIVSESISSWDWIMSVDPHWYSTLFGWYVFASFFVSGITTIAMVTVFLKGQGYLDFVNTSHLHDLAKFMFGISIFWTYLWFSQFMLIWYADIPEEVVYFKMRIENYNLPFFGMLALNFVLPILILVNSDFKRLSWIVVAAGFIILCGHYLDFFNMIMPGTVGDQWYIGAGEIGAILFFFGLFIFIVFTALAKVPLLAKGNPLVEESKHFQY